MAGNNPIIYFFFPCVKAIKATILRDEDDTVMVCGGECISMMCEREREREREREIQRQRQRERENYK